MAKKWIFSSKSRNVEIRISIFEIPCMPTFRQNKQLLLFWHKFAQKGIYIWKFIKIMLELESASLRYHVYQFSDKTNNFEFLVPNLPKNEFLGQNFKNPSLDSESASFRYHVYQFSDKTNNFDFLGPNLPKNGFWGRNFKNLSLDSESTPPIYHVCQFSVKMDNF